MTRITFNGRLYGLPGLKPGFPIRIPGEAFLQVLVGGTDGCNLFRFRGDANKTRIIEAVDLGAMTDIEKGTVNDDDRIFFVPPNSNLSITNIPEPLDPGYYCWLEKKVSSEWITAGPFENRSGAVEELRRIRAVNPVLS